MTRSADGVVRREKGYQPVAHKKGDTSPERALADDQELAVLEEVEGAEVSEAPGDE